MTVLSLVVLLAVCLGMTVGQSTTNGWDSPLSISCQNGKAIGYIKSYHSNSKEDRRFTVSCNKNVKQHTSCHWSGYVNWWDQPVSFTCPFNAVLAGIYSVHHNRYEDRRWKFRCCQTPIHPRYCRWTQWLNDWDGSMSYSTSHDRVIAGMYSAHDNRKEDRRFKLWVCHSD